MATRKATLTRDNTSRRGFSQTGVASGQGTGNRQILIAGKVRISGRDRRVRSFLRWTYDSDFWDGVEIVTSALVTFTVDNDGGDLSMGSAGRVSHAEADQGLQ